MFSQRKNKGFTLAEILVTLGVIGVIASMTVPTLVQDVQDAKYKASWKKDFSDFSQAAKRLSIDNAGNLSDAFNSSDSFRNSLLKYLNYNKLCNSGTVTNPDTCWHERYKLYGLSRNPITIDFIGYSRAILSNGTLAVFYLYNQKCNDANSANDDVCGSVFLDTNGFPGPNTMGKDVYALWVLKDGNTIPFGTQGDTWYNNPASYRCNSSAAGFSCSADYLYQ